MKKFLLLLATVVVVATVGCSKDDEKDPEEGNDSKFYSISLTNDSNGTAAASIGGKNVSKAQAGETVTLTATPAEGCEFTQWAVEGGSVNLSDKTANPVMFTMPAGKVFVRAEFASPAPITEPGVMIDNITWATRNIDQIGNFTANPENYGGYYTFEKAKTACPDGWRTPIQEEFISLANSGSQPATLNGVKGYYFGSGNQTVFFPLAGLCSSTDKTLGDDGLTGWYWSSDLNTTLGSSKISGYCLAFGGPNDGNFVYTQISTLLGSYLSVRCVKKW